jgi:hypothetical protein
MFHAEVHAVRWPLHIPTGTIRAIALMRLVGARVRELFCGLRGHDMVVNFEPQRLSLRCLRCGVHTQGWEIDVKPIYRVHQRVARSASRSTHPVGLVTSAQKGCPQRC